LFASVAINLKIADDPLRYSRTVTPVGRPATLTCLLDNNPVVGATGLFTTVSPSVGSTTVYAYE